MKTAPILISAALAMALAACGNDNTDPGEDSLITGMAADNDAADNTVPDPGPVDTGPDAAGPALDDPAMSTAAGDRRALMAVAEVDRHEIASAEDALSRGVEGDVRDYAQTLIDDHTRNLRETERLMDRASGSAPAAGSDTEVAAMKEKHDAEREHLSRLEGEEFTTAWIEAMVAGHEAALARLDNELIPGASDSEVTGHLRNARTAIAGHLETARSLQSNR